MTRRQPWSITDGREAVGRVELDSSGAYVAIDLAEQVVGRFPSLREAARVLENIQQDRG